MDKFKKSLKKFRQQLNKYAMTNKLFITYFILAVVGCIILRNVTIDIPFTLKSFLTELGMILLLGSFGYFVKPKNQYKYFFSVLILFTVIEIVNSVYYTFYAKKKRVFKI